VGTRGLVVALLDASLVMQQVRRACSGAPERQQQCETVRARIAGQFIGSAYAADEAATPMAAAMATRRCTEAVIVVGPLVR
jgi:hypothetical protein